MEVSFLCISISNTYSSHFSSHNVSCESDFCTLNSHYVYVSPLTEDNFVAGLLRLTLMPTHSTSSASNRVFSSFHLLYLLFVCLLQVGLMPVIHIVLMTSVYLTVLIRERVSCFHYLSSLVLLVLKLI